MKNNRLITEIEQDQIIRRAVYNQIINTIKQLAKGCNQSIAEIYALDTEIVISDPWERQFMLAYRAATMETKILALKIMQESNE